MTKDIPYGNIKCSFAVVDVGSGFLNGTTCTGGVLHIVLRMTKPRDISQVSTQFTFNIF